MDGLDTLGDEECVFFFLTGEGGKSAFWVLVCLWFGEWMQRCGARSE